MKKFLTIALLLMISIPSSFGYAVKVYDETGNRLGTYRKDGDNFVLYDFYDKKVENPEDLIKNAPNKQTLTDLSQYFYDEHLNPIGSFNTGLWNNYGRHYSREYGYNPYHYYNRHNNYIVRPGAHPLFPPPPPHRRRHMYPSGTYTTITNFGSPNYSRLQNIKLK